MVLRAAVYGADGAAHFINSTDFVVEPSAVLRDLNSFNIL